MTVTEDLLLGGRVRLRQPLHGYRAAIDPVLLAASIDPAHGLAVADLGCGAGAALLCLAARLPEIRPTGIERDPAMAALARDNLALNGIEGAVLEADIAAVTGRFDQVMMNPPFLPAARGRGSPDAGRRAAGVEDGPDLAGWIAAAARLLAPRGFLTVVHRADRLDDLVAALLPRFRALAICPLWPRAGEPARRVLVRARLGGRSPLALLPGLVLHDAAGAFTAGAEMILRDAAALPL